ncbi:hypothetical protein KW787_01525 [Candidatus Pacearchaeota archaeon]|nr:hypothetical protein [Candidatus Pacearchaeota archaeon]
MMNPKIRMEKAVNQMVKDSMALPPRVKQAVEEAILRVRLKKVLDYDEFI